MPVPGDYNQNIPQPTDQLSVSQADLLDNFGAIYALVGVNHVNFDAGTDAGKHKFVDFVTQAGNPGTAGNELAMYAKNSYGNPAVPALYIQKSTNAAVTNGGFTEFAGAPNSDGGWTRLPSGILLKWGFTQTGSATIGAKTITFPVSATIPAFTAIFSIQVSSVVTALNPSRTVNLMTNPTTLDFQVWQTTNSNSQLNYFAIGV